MKRKKSSTIVSTICVLFCLLFLSCTQGNGPIVTNYDNYIKTQKSPNEPLPLLEQQPYLSFGKLEQASFPDTMKVEHDLMYQIAAYNNAIIHGDIETCRSYIYPDAIRYIKNQHNGLSDNDVFKQYMKDFSRQLQNMITTCEKNGIEVSLVVPNLVRKIQIGSDIIIVYNTTTNFCSEYVYTYNNEFGQDIGISYNNGVDWYFFNGNEDAPTILKMRYSQEVVNLVMGYTN